jgi:HEPN domain-containing protein
MSTRRYREVRRFHRVAVQRFEEASFLLENGFTTAAVYLGGYAVECILKCLLLARTPPGRHGDAIASFTGRAAHSFSWLRRQLGQRGVNFPPEVVRQLTDVGSWTTDLRYSPVAVSEQEAQEFMAAVSGLLEWGEGGL